jgi:hypothetical protein
MVTTTVELPDDLLAEATRFATTTHIGMNKIIEQALRDWLERRQTASSVHLTTYGQGGLLPGVNLDDSGRLLMIMEAVDDPA